MGRAGAARFQQFEQWPAAAHRLSVPRNLFRLHRSGNSPSWNRGALFPEGIDAVPRFEFMDVFSRPKVGPGLSAQPSLAQPSLAQATSSEQALQRAERAPDPLGIIRRIAASGELRLDTRAHLEHVLRLDPTAVKPRVLLFLVELGEQRFAAAEAIVDALVHEYPDDPDHLANYAELALRTLELDKSRQLTARALHIDPKHVEAQRVKVVLDVVMGEAGADQRSNLESAAARAKTEHAAKENAPTEDALARLIEQRADAPQVLFSLFQALVARHRLEEAVRLGRELLRVQPHNTELDTALLDVRVLTHPLGAPLYPLRRMGVLGVGALALFAAALYYLFEQASDTLAAVFALVCGAFIAYAVSYPALMRGWLRDRTP